MLQGATAASERTSPPLVDSVTKLHVADGSEVGTYLTGKWPYGIAFDGANMFVANYGSTTVTKL